MRQRRRSPACAGRYGLRLIGPNALGIINTDPDVQLNASLSLVMPPPRPQRASSASPARSDRRSWQKVQNRGLGLTTFVTRRQPRRRLGQRPPAVLAGGRRDRGRPALPGVDRQPAQVLPHRPPRQPPQADRRRAVRAQHAGCARWATPCARSRRRAAGGRRDVPPGRGHPGRHAGGDVRRRPAARPPAAARGRRVAVVGNSDAARPARRRRRHLRRARGQQAGRARRRRRRRGLRGRPRRGDRRPRGRRGRRDLHPAAQRLRRGRRQRARRRRRAVRQADRVDLPRAPRACPSCCASPTSRARAPAAARCRRTPPSRPPCAPWRTGRRVRRVAAHAADRPTPTRRSSTGTAPAASSTSSS